jgi:hypothetical protein
MRLHQEPAPDYTTSSPYGTVFPRARRGLPHLRSLIRSGPGSGRAMVRRSWNAPCCLAAATDSISMKVNANGCDAGPTTVTDSFDVVRIS